MLCMGTTELKPELSGACPLAGHCGGASRVLLGDVLSPGLWAGPQQPCRDLILGGIGKKEGPDFPLENELHKPHI